MERKGTGYAHEILIAFFVLVLAITFYAKDAQAAMPPIMLILGAVMLLGGIVVKEPLLMTGGIVLFAVALMYSEVVL
jgi:hypothetical protein